MADITMCEGTGCPRKDECYRHTAMPHQWWQSYFVETPYDPKRMTCDHYAPGGKKQEPTP